RENTDMATAIASKAPALAGTRLADYLQLIRPRLCPMALLTVAAGAVLASGGTPDWRVLTHAVVGAALVAAGARALNQALGREAGGGGRDAGEAGPAVAGGTITPRRGARPGNRIGHWRGRLSGRDAPTPAGRRGRRSDVPDLRLRLHAAQAPHVAQYTGRSHP